MPPIPQVVPLSFCDIFSRCNGAGSCMNRGPDTDEFCRCDQGFTGASCDQIITTTPSSASISYIQEGVSQQAIQSFTELFAEYNNHVVPTSLPSYPDSDVSLALSPSSQNDFQVLMHNYGERLDVFKPKLSSSNDFEVLMHKYRTQLDVFRPRFQTSAHSDYFMTKMGGKSVGVDVSLAEKPFQQVQRLVVSPAQQVVKDLSQQLVPWSDEVPKDDLPVAPFSATVHEENDVAGFLQQYGFQWDNVYLIVGIIAVLVFLLLILYKCFGKKKEEEDAQGFANPLNDEMLEQSAQVPPALSDNNV